MSQSELLIRVVRTLDRIGIDYMVTGSIASSLQGEPRSTHDVDFVVSIEEADIDQLVSAFPRPDFYVDAAAARDAIAHHSMFNLIDVREGDNVDFWILTSEPFDRSRFSRKYEERIMGVGLKVSAPEDTILVKLRWAKEMGGSEKQFTDALRVYEVQHASLDFAYMDQWAIQLHIVDLLARLRDQAEIV